MNVSERVIAVPIVTLAIVVGSVIAGDPTVGPYAELRQPSWAPGLPVWFAVAAIYYVIMAVVLTRLFARQNESGAYVAIAMTIIVLIASELWNVSLFRLGRADYAFYTILPIAVLTFIAALTALRVDWLSA
ncbi:MAG: tryptophan-rich sensory protein, partial [Pseudomonadota bacterium]